MKPTKSSKKHKINTNKKQFMSIILMNLIFKTMFQKTESMVFMTVLKVERVVVS